MHFAKKLYWRNRYVQRARPEHHYLLRRPNKGQVYIATDATQIIRQINRKRPALGRRGRLSKAGRGKRNRKHALITTENELLPSTRDLLVAAAFLMHLVTGETGWSGKDRRATADPSGPNGQRSELESML